MSDNSRRVSRRTALKGIAGVATVGSVGAGGLIHASEPVAAVEHQLAVEDIVIETYDGGVAQMGIRELWFEASWNNIPDSLHCGFRFNIPGQALSTLDSGDLGVSGEGTETFGFGQQVRDEFDVNIGSLGFETPLTTDTDTIPDQLALSDDEDEKTTTLQFEIRLFRMPEDSIGVDELSVTGGEFDVVVQRLEPESGVDEGEADPFGSE